MKNRLCANTFLLAIIGFTSLSLSCANPTSSDKDEKDIPAVETPTTETPAVQVTAPEALKGTIAFADRSAILTIQVASASRAVSRSASREIRAVTGNIRYEGIDFSIAGEYDSTTGAISGTSATLSLNSQSVRFQILGVYTVAGGFTGSVKRYADGIITGNGSVTALPSTVATINTIRNFRGTFGGDSFGTWNMSLKGLDLIGTWANIDGSGRFTARLTDTSIAFTSAYSLDSDTGVWSQDTLIGGGSLSGTIVTGMWNMTSRDNGIVVFQGSGYWSGAEVSTAGDAYMPSPTDDNFGYRFSIIMQVIQTASESMMQQLDGEDPTGSYTNEEDTISCTGTDNGDGTWTFALSFINGGYQFPMYDIHIDDGDDILEIVMDEAGELIGYNITAMQFSGSFIVDHIGIMRTDQTIEINPDAGEIDGTVYVNNEIEAVNNKIDYLKSFFSSL